MDSGFTSPFPQKLVSQESMFSVDYTCLRCCHPLKLLTQVPFHDFSDKQTKCSILPHSNSDQTNKNDSMNKRYEDGIHRKIMIPIVQPEASIDFVFVDELSNLPLHNDQTLRVTSRFTDIMCDQSDVSHPLCEECTDNLLDQMDHQLKTSEEECKEYKDILENLHVDVDEGNLEKLSKELDDLLETEAQLLNELSAVEGKNTETKELLKNLEDECEALQRQEDKQLKDFFRAQRHSMISEDHYQSINNQLLYAQKKLHLLNKTSILEATFHIWHIGPFGTINNFRLGRLLTVPVEWPEINAAWGQTVLLLHSLAKKMDFTFTRYRLVPYGNHSYIESLENKSKELRLYCLGGSKFMMDIKFDLAMVAFLDCLIQFKDHVEQKRSARFKLPYHMEKGKIEDSSHNSYSIKAQLNSEEQWTKALKLMLTNLKWALVWVSAYLKSGSDP